MRILISSLLLFLLAATLGLWAPFRALKERVLHRVSSGALQGENWRVEVSDLAGNHAFGIVCGKSVWDKFADHAGSIDIEATPAAIQVQRCSGAKGSLGDQVLNFHVMAFVSGRGVGTVTITLPKELAAELLRNRFSIAVIKDPSQTKF